MTFETARELVYRQPPVSRDEWIAAIFAAGCQAEEAYLLEHDLHDPPPTKSEWRAAILAAEGDRQEVLIDRGPYRSLTGVKSSQTKHMRVVRERIVDILEIHADMRHCYLWTPPPNARMRRDYEARRCNEMSFQIKGRRYEVSQTCKCSTRNIYYKLAVKVDGIKKDVRALRALAPPAYQ